MTLEAEQILQKDSLIEATLLDRRDMALKMTLTLDQEIALCRERIRNCKAQKRTLRAELVHVNRRLREGV